MKNIVLAFVILAMVSCSKTSVDTADSANANVDLTAIQQGTLVPSDYLAANRAVVQALNEFNATLTPQKVSSYKGNIDRVITDMTAFVDQRLGQQSQAIATANGRSSADAEPSAAVKNWVNSTNGQLDALEGQLDADKIGDEQAKGSTVGILATSYGQVQQSAGLTEADRNALLSSHYSANGLLSPVESILEKVAQSSPNGRPAGFWKKLRKAIITFIRTIVVKTVESFAKGCVASGSVQGCVAGGTAKASGDLSSNAQSAIGKAAGTIK